MPDTQSQRLGKYDILAEIGKGGFATVYRALDTDLGREVALKVLDPLLMRDPAWVARFRQEARTIAALDHPRIVPIYEIGQAEGILFIAMKLLPGGSLAHRIKAGPLPWAEVVRLTGEIAEALDFAHGRKVLHRDLKPANVLLDEDGHAVLTDFGFARLVADHSLSVSISGGGVVGTPAYIAPEVWEGEPSGRPADLYALGCIVYELASGVQPFGGGTTPAVMRAHFQPLAVPGRWPEGVPSGLGDMLETALAKAPTDRYSSAGELAAAVAGLTIDALAEPYAALQVAVTAGDWAHALALAGQIRTQKPDCRDVAALEAQALAGQERAARAKQAATWHAEAESALTQGDRVAAALAIKQWAALTPEDPVLAEFHERVKESPSSPVDLTVPPDRSTRSSHRWITIGIGVLVLFIVIIILTQVSRQDNDNNTGVVPGTPALATTGTTVEVDSRAGWQQTGISVRRGQSLTITHVIGQWSQCQANGCPYVGAEGVAEQLMDWPDNVIMGCPHAALIAQISGATPFCVSSQ